MEDCEDGCLLDGEVVNDIIDLLEERSEQEVESILESPLFQIAGNIRL